MIHSGKDRLLAYSILLVLALSACSGKGGSDSQPKEAPSSGTPKVMIFTDTSPVDTGDSLTASVEIEGVEDTFYAAFDLTYDPTIVEYQSATEGKFLSRNGADPTSFQVAQDQTGSGRLTVGVTRLGNIGPVSGSGSLLTLHFKAVGPGTSPLSLSSPRGLRNSSNANTTVNSWKNSSISIK